MPNTISTIFSFKEQGGGLKKIKADVMAADTATGKLKAGWAGAMASLKANAASATAAAGAALAVFGAKAVKGFTDAAIAAGQFAEATGVSTSEASQWISAAGDLGINADLVQKAFQKANKEVAEGGPIMEQYGISVVHAADGSVDANETFLKTIDIVNGIQDPTEKARVAQELFGRSYGDVAELIFQDADKVRAALESTSEQQIFDEAEVEKAREYREAMDRLADAVQDFSMIVGERLTPALTDAANVIADVDAAADGLGDAVPGLSKAFDIWSEGMDTFVKGPLKLLPGLFGDSEEAGSAFVDSLAAQALATAKANAEVEAAAEATAKARKEQEAQEKSLLNLNESYDDLYDNSKELERAQKDHNVELMRLNQSYDRVDGAVDKTNQSMRDLTATYERLRGTLNDEATYDNLVSNLQEVDRVAAQTFDNAEDAALAARDANRNLAGSVLDYMETIEGIPDNVTTQVTALLDRERYEEAARLLADFERTRYARVVVNVSQGARLTSGGDIIGQLGGRRAHGGPVSAGDMYQVGEGGKPELLEQNGKHYLIPGDNGRVTPATSGGVGGGGGDVIVQVSVDARGAMDPVAVGRQTADALEAFFRNGGQAPPTLVRRLTGG